MIILSFSLISCAVVLIILYQNTLAFNVHSSPTYISGGSNGHSLVVEVSYTNDQFETLFNNLSGKPVVLLIEQQWFERSPKQLKKIKDYKFEIGLLLSNEMTSEEIDEFIQKATTYFNQNIVWAGCFETVCSQSILQYLYEQQINTLAITHYIEEGEKLEELPQGTIAAIQLKDHTTLSEEAIKKLNAYPFISLEDNIFRLSVRSKRIP